MLHEYSNLYFPVCSLIVSLLIFVLYFSKKNIKNSETKLYSTLLKLTLLEAIFTFSLTLSVHLFFNESTTLYFAIANKILYSIYILWISILFLYFSNLSYEDKGQMKIFKSITIILDTILIFLIFLMPIELVYLRSEKISNSYGAASIILYIGCALYIFLMSVITLINYKDSSNKKKYVPLFLLIILMIAIMVIRVVDPYFNATSNVISFIALVMYFTIENPDLKMLNKLQLAQAQAEKSNQIKSEFLSSMSHEIRTPLNAISGYSQLINETEDINEIKGYSKEIVDSTNLLLHMFSNIIDVYELESKDIKINNKDYDFYTEINNLLDLYEDRAIAKKLLLFKEINPSIPKMYGDVNIIKKILVNILDNAIYYTDTGNITVKVENTVEKQKCILKISISDTGCGIKPDHLKNLFQDFERGIYKNSAKNGTGLGLSISKRLVELLNGKIEIESEVDKGTTVKVTLNQKLSEMEEKNESINS